LISARDILQFQNLQITDGKSKSLLLIDKIIALLVYYSFLLLPGRHKNRFCLEPTVEKPVLPPFIFKYC
jgi:hypothetical protein